jgi:hypothetical protein
MFGLEDTLFKWLMEDLPVQHGKHLLKDDGPIKLTA